MRQIVLDTETTGIDPKSGHKIIEIGCVELIKRKFTGNNLHLYLNPEREIDAGAFRVHGISNDFLQDKPLFSDIAQEFLDYVCGAELIIHNADFDIGFLNHELELINHPQKMHKYCKVLDTLKLARKMHPGQRNNLDALCKRYSVNNSNRTLHGALLDAEILAFVYLAMTGGQSDIFSQLQNKPQSAKIKNSDNQQKLQSNSPVLMPSEQELLRHEQFMASVNRG